MEVILNKNCPCPKTDCPNNKNCTACKKHHKEDVSYESFCVRNKIIVEPSK